MGHAPILLQSKIERPHPESREYVFLTREFTDLSGTAPGSARVCARSSQEGRLVRPRMWAYTVLAFTSGVSGDPRCITPHVSSVRPGQP